MIKIGICDDQLLILDRIKNIVLSVMHNTDKEVFIDTFSDSQEFLNKIEQKDLIYDVILLDIDMPKVSGFDIAKQINESSSKSLIIFITSHNKFVFEAFQYQPFRYIRKNVMELELEEALKTALNNIITEKKYYYCKTADENVRIDFDDILYFELVNRRINFHTKNQLEYYTWSSISGLMETFKKQGFVQIHSGASVNVKYIRSFTNKDVTLDNGERLPVSRSRSKEVAMELSRYWGDKV